MTNQIRAILIGLSPMGKLIGKRIVKKRGIMVVGAVDIDKNLINKDLGVVLELERNMGVSVTNDTRDLLSRVDADIAVSATTSYLKNIYSSTKICIEASVNVISTCEELSYP